MSDRTIPQPACRAIEGTVDRPAPVSFTVDGKTVGGVPGESLAIALLGAGIRRLRHSPRDGMGRGFFCLMGVCQECLVTIDGQPKASCLEPVRAGMTVSLGPKP
jgi:predicted molibdopterin-dependent oxidoreductase YjgC